MNRSLHSLECLLELRRALDSPLFKEGDVLYIIDHDTKYSYTFKNVDEENAFLKTYGSYVNTPIMRMPLRICTNEVVSDRFKYHVPSIQYIKQVFKTLELSVFDCSISAFREKPIIIKLVKYCGSRVVDIIDIPTLYREEVVKDVERHSMFGLVSVLEYSINLTLEPHIDNSWIDIDCLNVGGHRFKICLAGKGVVTF